MGHGLKRKLPQDSFSMDELNEDLLERILSWLPTSAFFRLNCVSKRWKSAANSASFKLACSRVPSRDPLFLMVSPNLNQSVVFDSAENSWKRLNHPRHLREDSNQGCMPVAASGGLVCYRKSSGNFIVCNPVTGSCSELPPLHLASDNHQSLNAVVMSSSTSNGQQSYKIVLVLGEIPNLFLKFYDSTSVCNGELVVVLLSEFLESASLRVWKFDEANRCWQQIVVMPAAMSHEWYGKKADINCVGAGDRIFICLNSPELCTYIVCDLVNNSWVELPKCCINGEVMEFMSAFSFEPRIEASV
ncbi:hypothetical protein PIB30_019475 [Stylosanthes scabra]|uniref:F-box domain-containing protein n=1 Tax=Stylosanthes scabra TaxID=79078 RepID=A0ABU6T7Z0_9FABA|nr:hypothetical protein [Stylosanthes scabra]